MLGRNELCPCGSGKKYKRCCLNKDVVVDRAGRKVGTAQKQYSELYTRIYEYSRQDKFKEEYEKAKEMFYIVDDEALNSKFDRFFNTYFIQDHIMESKKVMTVAFYEDNRDKVNTNEVKILRNLFESYVSVYEVKEVLDGKILLKDCLTEREVYTEDVKLLADFKVGSSMIARIVDVEDTSILIDITISISDAVKEVIVNDIKTEIIKNGTSDTVQIAETINNVTNNYHVTLTDAQVKQITDLMEKIAAQNYDYNSMKETLNNVSDVVQDNLEKILKMICLEVMQL